MSTAGGGRRARALAYTAVTTAIVLVFALAEWAAERFVSEHSRAASIAIEIAVVLAAALVFRPIHVRVEAAVEAAFTKRKRAALDAIVKLRRELTSFNDLAQLLRRVVEGVDQHFEARACAVYLRREAFRAEASSFDMAAGTVEHDDPLVVRLRSSSAAAQPALLKSTAHGTHAFPMTLAGDLVGFLTVHARRDDYDAEELEMLGGLAQDLAGAVVALDPGLRPQGARVPNNLPADLPELIGREHEQSEIAAALAQSRLVTVVGTGGVGKTLIALQCALRELRGREHGAWLVNLAPLTDGALVETTIASALGASDAIEHLRARDALLVIDNCEQVVGDVAQIAKKILAQCPRVSVLATSRELLHVEGEHVYRLRPLRTESAVQLFNERAASIATAFEPGAHEQAVRAICEQLDGIPLAVELAAARVRALSPEEIVGRLGERFRLLGTAPRTASPHHQTLEATIAWSYDLLSGEEQSLFARLSAFRGSFSLAAAAAVCAEGGNCDEYHVLDVLTSLADKSLIVVRMGAVTRYRLLETIREFAAKKNVERQAEAIAREQHAGFFSALAAQAYHEFDTRLPPGWLDRLAPDIDNFRAALEWTLDGPGQRHTGAQLAADCGPIFLRMQLLDEGLRWCEIAQTVRGVSPATAGRIDYVASMMHNNLGAAAAALADAQRAVRHYEVSSDARGTIRALSQLAQQYSRAGRYEDAQQPASQAIERARALGEPRVLASVLRRCAYALPPERIDAARELFGEALAIAKSIQDPEEVCMILEWWATREAAAGNLTRAIDLARDGIACAGTTSRLTLEMDVTAWAFSLGDLAQAKTHALESMRLVQTSSHPLLRALAVAYCAAFVAQSDARDAARLLGYAQSCFTRLGWNPRDDDATALANVAQAIRSRLSDADYAQLLESGAAWNERTAFDVLQRLNTAPELPAPAVR